MDLSNFLTLTADNKKLPSPLQSEDIWRHFELCIGKLNLFLVLSTSNCHHVNPPVSAVVKCKMVDLDYYGLKMFMALLRTLFPRNLFPHPSCWSLLRLQWYFAWCPLVTVNVDSNHPTLSQIPTCLWNGNYQILPGIPIRSIDSPLTKVGDLRNLWSYVFCKVVQMTTVADHLDNAGFNTIAERSLLELMYIINQEKTSLQMDITAAMLSLSLYRIILPYLCFLVIVFKCVLFVTTALQSSPVWCYICEAS